MFTTLRRLAIASQSQSNDFLQRFAADRSATVAMVFALLVIPVTAVLGLAVNLGRVYKVISHTQSALDSAALAAGRVAQVETSEPLAKASAAASAYFDEARPLDVLGATLQFSPNTAQTRFTVTATTWVKTPFRPAAEGPHHPSRQTARRCRGAWLGRTLDKRLVELQPLRLEHDRKAAALGNSSEANLMAAPRVRKRPALRPVVSRMTHTPAELRPSKK
jgi:Flp pilus assembly protein TadG